jgi:hypothetical protein
MESYTAFEVRPEVNGEYGGVAIDIGSPQLNPPGRWIKIVTVFRYKS